MMMIMMYFNIYFYVLKMIRKLMLAIHKNWRGEGWIGGFGSVCANRGGMIWNLMISKVAFKFARIDLKVDFGGKGGGLF